MALSCLLQEFENLSHCLMNLFYGGGLFILLSSK